MASIYIKNYMKEKRLLVAKNAKVNKKSFMLIFYQFCMFAKMQSFIFLIKID